MYCNKCGGNVPGSASFCPKCGNRMNYMNYGPRIAYQPVKPKKSSAPAIITGILGFIVCAVILFFVIRTLSNGGLGANSSAPSGHHSAESSPSAPIESAEASPDESAETSAGKIK